MLKKLFAILFLICWIQAVGAETFTVLLEGMDLKKTAVIDLKLKVEPKKSINFKEEFFVITVDPETKEKKFWKKKILFKYFSPINTSIKIFFKELLDQDKVYIIGKYERNNYSGPVDIILKKKHFIPDFNKVIAENSIKANIIAETDEDVLPYHGISKAKVLGPEERIFSPRMRISIGDIETYGFKLSGKITDARINGKQAKIFDDKIISTFIELDESNVDKDLDIELEIEVDNNMVKKTIGSIHIVEAIQDFKDKEIPVEKKIKGGPKSLN
jgi:hypothetical protein